MKWLAVLLVLLMCGAASAATSDFGYYKIISVNQTMVNDSIGTGQYPLLVSTTDANLSTRCQADGDDIVFFDADNTTQLDHEIESWNKTTGVLVAWVNLTDVTNVSTIGVYYYDADGTNLEDVAGVWDGNYMLVQHLQETDIDGGAGDIKDSTQYGNNGTTSGMDSADQVAGQIDGSFDLDGSADYVKVGTIGDFGSGMGSNVTTFSAWIKSSDTSSLMEPIGTVNTGDTFIQIILNSDNSESIHAGFIYASMRDEDGNILGGAVHSDTGITDGSWHHLVTKQNATSNTVLIYIDGVSQTIAYSSQNTPDNTADFQYNMTIGGRNLRGVIDRYYDGIIDEARISNTSRSAEYIETGYNNTKSPALFISIGSEHAVSGDTTAPSVTSVSDSPDPQGFGENVTISATITDASGVHTAYAGITPPGGSETNYSMSNVSSAYSYDFADWTNGSYSYKIYANDSADNWNNTETGTFELYSETYINIKTLKDTYGAGEYVNITDPFKILISKMFRGDKI